MHRVRRPVLILLIGGVLVVALLWAFQRRLVYFPDTASPRAPGDVVEVTTTASDGLVLHGWLVAAADEDAPLVIVLHGNAGHRGHRLPLASALRPHGVSTLLTDYRGYGGNPGSPSEDGLQRDALAWRRWADEHHDGPVAYFGESLGAAVAVWLALEAPPSALVLRSPFTSLPDIGRVHYPWLPVGALLKDRYEVAGPVADLAVPLLVVAGTADTIVPPEQSRAVHDAAANAQPRRWVAVPGAGHNDAALLDGDALVDAVVALLTPT